VGRFEEFSALNRTIPFIDFEAALLTRPATPECLTKIAGSANLPAYIAATWALNTAGSVDPPSRLKDGAMHD